MMKNREFRKCGKRSKDGKKWNIGIPLPWIQELEWEEAMMELTKEENIVTIRKVGETITTITSENFKEKIKPVEPSSADDEDGKGTENRIKGVGRLVY